MERKIKDVAWTCAKKNSAKPMTVSNGSFGDDASNKCAMSLRASPLMQSGTVLRSLPKKTANETGGRET